MRVIQWNTVRVGSQMSGIKKYEDELYRNIIKIIKKQNLNIEIYRILRYKNKILGSTVVSWFLRYRDNGADLVHATSQVLAPVIYLRRPKRFIVTVHDLIPLIYPQIIKDLSTKLQWILTPRALKKVDRIIAISNFTKKEIIRLLKIQEDMIDVVYQGVDHTLYAPMDKDECKRHFGLKTEEKHILYVASNDEHKRVELAKAVFEEIKNCREDVRLIKAGYSQKLTGEGIISMSWLDEKDMPKLYNSADVYLHTSEYEGFGLPVLEAMACGVPVVTSNKASLPEIVGDAGVLVDLDENCVYEFSENILRILDRNPRPDKKALERAKQFSWEKTAEETLKVYEEVSKA